MAVCLVDVVLSGRTDNRDGRLVSFSKGAIRTELFTLGVIDRNDGEQSWNIRWLIGWA